MFPVSIENGGTGATTALSALNNLIESPLSIELGGTNGQNAVDAMKNFGITGTWTPILVNIGEPSINPSVADYEPSVGNYVRFGPFCFVSFNINTNVTNIGTGTAAISGLPFRSIVNGSYYQALSTIKAYCENGFNSSGDNGAHYVIPDSNSGDTNASVIQLLNPIGVFPRLWGLGQTFLSASGIYVLDSGV